MKKQTFAQKLWLSPLPRVAELTAIPGFDTWLLRQVHRTTRGPASGSPAGRPSALLALARRIAGLQR
jgi:hypothetical protein